MDSEILRGKPFYLSDEDVKWAEETFSSMTTEEKIGQLFFLIVYGPDAETIDKIAKEIGAGGAMCRAMPTENVVVALVIGGASGLSATGVHQAIKQIKKKDDKTETPPEDEGKK